MHFHWSTAWVYIMSIAQHRCVGLQNTHNIDLFNNNNNKKCLHFLLSKNTAPVFIWMKFLLTLKFYIFQNVFCYIYKYSISSLYFFDIILYCVRKHIYYALLLYVYYYVMLKPTKCHMFCMNFATVGSNLCTCKNKVNFLIPKKKKEKRVQPMSVDLAVVLDDCIFIYVISVCLLRIINCLEQESIS